jgi:adenylosuccinate synthase
MPTDIDDMAELKPVYRKFPGWQADTSAARKWNDLPMEARKYLQAIANVVGAKIMIASIGPARTQTIIL